MKKGEVVVCEAGDVIPADGEVIEVNYKDGDLVEPGQTIIRLNPSDSE